MSSPPTRKLRKNRSLRFTHKLFVRVLAERALQVYVETKGPTAFVILLVAAQEAVLYPI